MQRAGASRVVACTTEVPLLQFREALQLFYVDGLTAREAAQTLGITHSALKCRVSRARAQLVSNLSK